VGVERSAINDSNSFKSTRAEVVLGGSEALGEVAAVFVTGFDLLPRSFNKASKSSIFFD